jgi:tetratricopeptide (TPR) repeat protein
LTDVGNLPAEEEKKSDDGRIQNKNIVIDLQPIFILLAYPNESAEYISQQYYNFEVEKINNRNNYNPIVTISNKLFGEYKEQYQNQILFFNEKIKINSKETFNFLSRGLLYYLVDEYALAMNDLNKSIALEDKNMLAYFSRANGRLKMTDEIQQISKNSELINISFKKGQQQNTETETSTITDYQDVLTDYRVCLQLNPKFAYSYYNQAYVKCKLKDYEGSLADLNKAIEIESDFAEAYFNRGLTRIYLDDVEGGAMDLSKAGELGIQDAYNVIKRYCN